MKVNITEYGSYINAFIIANFLFGWLRNDHLVDKVEGFLKPLEHFLPTGEQSVYVKIEPWDTWSLDSTLSEVICPALEEFKLRTIAIKHVDNEDLPEHLQIEPDEYGSTHNGKGWDFVVDEMIFGFKHGSIEENQPEEVLQRADNGRRLFAKYFHHLWT